MPKCVIELIARGVLSTDLGVLLCRNKRRSYSYLPGGHVEFGESAEAAVVREFREETGLKVRTTSLLGVQESSFTDSRARHEMNLVFHVEHIEGPILHNQPSLEPKIEFHWLGLDRLECIDFRPKSMLEIIVQRSRWVTMTKVG